jgi:hypothetical protein
MLHQVRTAKMVGITIIRITHISRHDENGE